MNERILNLLSLCLQARENGCHVTFECSFYTVTIWYMLPDENNDFYIQKKFRVNLSDMDNLEEAETYLRGLVA